MSSTLKLPLICALCFVCLSLAACAERQPTVVTDFHAPVHHAPEHEHIDETSPFYVYDPLESWNRQVYDFNARLDQYLLMPIVTVYEHTVPEIMQTGFSNFFSNVGEVSTFVNCVLQLDVDGAANTFARFVTNTTIGLGGFIDIAEMGGIEKEEEDFGQTLGTWGVPPGPYLVLPVFGPSNLRDTGGLGVDLAMVWIEENAVLNYLDPNFTFAFRAGYLTVKGIDVRKKILFTYYQDGSLFEYDIVRFIYSKKREWDIEKH